MKEIKFRGKRIDNGEWVYGYYVFSPKSNHISGTTLSEYDKDTHWIISNNKKHEIIPETVGQYTGLKDKNGEEIYEDDVVRLLPKDKRKRSQIAIVKFDEDSLSFIGINGSSYFFLPQYEIELIGNIHEDFTLYEI